MASRTENEATMSLPEAAKALGMSWHRAWRLVLMRKLDGHQDGRGRYRVTTASVRAFQKADAERAARDLVPA